MKFNLSKTLKIKDSAKCCEKKYEKLVGEFKDTINKLSNDVQDLKDKASDVDNTKTDKYISEISYEREGNNIILKYIYNDGGEKTITLEDKDTIGILYDDTEVRNKITNLENEINTLKSDIAELKEFKDMVTELLDGNIGGWRP